MLILTKAGLLLSCNIIIKATARKQSQRWAYYLTADQGMLQHLVKLRKTITLTLGQQTELVFDSLQVFLYRLVYLT